MSARKSKSKSKVVSSAPAERRPAFPFVGAGEAAYFEWAEVRVCFEREPTRAEASAIAKLVPLPLRDSVAWTGPLLTVASEQGVGRVIAAAYRKKPREASSLTTRGRFAQAGTSADARFNADIEAWLEVAHAKVPILVAFRAEDLEAGGTKLSAWHRASLPELPRILETLARSEHDAIASLALSLAEVARAAKLPLDKALVRELEQRAEAAEEAEAEARGRQWEALAAKATAALGAPAPRYATTRNDASLAAALADLAKALPATAKRLARCAKNGLTVRPGATAAALAAAEKALGAKLSAEHRALLEAFDGGQIDDVTILGTAKGGANADAELATFTHAWSGESDGYIVIAHTNRGQVLVYPRGGSGPVHIMNATPGWGGGTTTRQCKELDTALDLVFKAGRV